MIEKGVLNIFHFKMTSLILRLRYFYVTDLNDFLSSCHYSAIIVHHLGMFFLWIYKAMHKRDSFIVSGADLENTKKYC